LVGVVGRSLANEADHCISDRTIKLKKQRRGKDRQLKTTSSDAKGGFSFEKRGGHGRFYAKAPRKVVQVGNIKVICIKARSKTIRRP